MLIRTENAFNTMRVVAMTEHAKKRVQFHQPLAEFQLGIDLRHEIFKLTDNLLPPPTAEALKVARSLTRGGLQPTSIAYRMARHLALVLQVRARQDRGESLSDVQEKMSEHRFVLQKAYDAAKGADPRRLEAGLRAIRDYEWEVKSGQVDAELGLDVLLTRL